MCKNHENSTYTYRTCIYTYAGIHVRNIYLSYICAKDIWAFTREICTIIVHGYSHEKAELIVYMDIHVRNLYLSYTCV